jgi:hypothetical protein
LKASNPWTIAWMSLPLGLSSSTVQSDMVMAVPI